MYLSPLVDKVIRPAKPVANFSIAHEGLKVTFQNRSAAGTEGWWDFGDGSALEPFSPKQETVTHPYPKPGVYTAKLTLRNLLGEENERSVTVDVQGGAAGPPAIDALQVVPLRPDTYAPATFRVVGKVKNAELCIWSLGDDQPLEISADAGSDRVVTFKRPGTHVIKLVAVSGKQTAERVETVRVGEPPRGKVMAMLTVSDQGTRVQTLEPQTVNVSVGFPAQQKENVYRFEKPVPLPPAWALRPEVTVKEAKLLPVTEPSLKNLKLELAADRRSVRLTGELSRATGLLHRNQPPPRAVVPVLLTLQRQTPAA